MNIIYQNQINNFVTLLSANTLSSYTISFQNVQDKKTIETTVNEESYNTARYSEFSIYFQNYNNPNLNLTSDLFLTADTYVYDSIVIPSGVTLTIPTGTTVYCMSGLTSVGTIVNEQNIIFTGATDFSIIKIREGNHIFQVKNGNNIYRSGVAYVTPILNETTEYNNVLKQTIYEYRG